MPTSLGFLGDRRSTSPVGNVESKDGVDLEKHKEILKQNHGRNVDDVLRLADNVWDQSEGPRQKKPSDNRSHNVRGRTGAICHKVAQDNSEAPDHRDRINELVKHIESNVGVTPKDLAVNKNRLEIASPSVSGPTKHLLQKVHVILCKVEPQ